MFRKPLPFKGYKNQSTRIVLKDKIKSMFGENILLDKTANKCFTYNTSIILIFVTGVDEF